MTHALARTNRPGELAAADNITPLPLGRLDPYAGGLVEIGDTLDPLAIISFGYRDTPRGDRPGFPKATRAGDERHLHLKDPQGRAPGLAAALAAGNWQKLLIAFPWDDPALIVQQRFTRYSQTRLEAYGDSHSLTWIHPGDAKANPPKPPTHQVFAAGTEEYERLARTCKADTRIYFCLAEWTEDGGSDVVFPDGMGIYALRTTSRHTVRSILQSINYLQRFTRGRIRAIPWELALDFREVAGPDGTKRTIPVGTITNRPPTGIRLSARTFQRLTTQALETGAALMLPAPSAPTLESFEDEGPSADLVDEPSEDDLARLSQGGPCDVAHWTRAWHALAKGTPLEADDARAAFLRRFTSGQFDSLSAYLHGASETLAAALIAAEAEEIGRATQHDRARKFDEIFGTDEDEPTPVAIRTPEGRTVATESGEVLEDRPEPEAVLDGEFHDGEPELANAPKMVTKTSAPAYQQFAELVQEYAALGGDMQHECVRITLPIALDALAEKARVLRQMIAEVEGDSEDAADEDTPAESPEVIDAEF